MLDRDRIQTLLTPAVAGGAAVSVAAMKALLGESLTTMMLTAQAKLLFPQPGQLDERRGTAVEFRVMALARGAAEAALAIARLPRETAEGLRLAPARRGALPSPSEPRLLELVSQIADRQALAGAESEPKMSIVDAYNDIEARLTAAAANMRERRPELFDAAEQSTETDIRMEDSEDSGPLARLHRPLQL